MRLELIHLTEVLEEEMKERGWGMQELIMNMGPFYSEKEWAIAELSWELFFEVRDKNVVLGEKMAQQLADAFDISPRFFIDFHENWRKAR